MKIAFACDGCGSRYEVDEAHAGKTSTCRRCGIPLAVPSRSAAPAEAETYAVGGAESEVSTFAPSRQAADPASGRSPARSSPPSWLETPRSPRKKRRKGADIDRWRRVAVGAAVASAALLVVALLMPNGKLIAGGVLVVAGLVALLSGFAVGAYGAFREDVLYGILYVCFPLYTGYYIVTRWDDLKPWFLAMTAGAVLVFVGAGLLESALPALGGGAV